MTQNNILQRRARGEPGVTEAFPRHLFFLQFVRRWRAITVEDTPAFVQQELVHLREFDANLPAPDIPSVQAGPMPAGHTGAAIPGAAGTAQPAGTTSRRKGPLPRMIRPASASSSSRPGPTNPAGGGGPQLATQGASLPVQIYPRPPGADQIPNPLYSQPDPSVIYVRTRPISARRVPVPAPAPAPPRPDDMDIDEPGPSLSQLNRDDDNENEDEGDEMQGVEEVMEGGIRVYKPPCHRCNSVGRPCAIVKKGEACEVCKRNKYQCIYGKKTAAGKAVLEGSKTGADKTDKGAGKKRAGAKGVAKSAAKAPKGAAKGASKGAGKGAGKTRKGKGNAVSEDSDMSPVIPTGPIGERYVEISDDMDDHPKQARRQAGKAAARDRGLAATVQKRTSDSY